MPEHLNPARRHHVVSKFYLKRFAAPQGGLMCRPLDGTAHLETAGNLTVR
jgi:hypothetical protein